MIFWAQLIEPSLTTADGTGLGALWCCTRCVAAGGASSTGGLTAGASALQVTRVQCARRYYARSWPANCRMTSRAPVVNFFRWRIVYWLDRFCLPWRSSASAPPCERFNSSGLQQACAAEKIATQRAHAPPRPRPREGGPSYPLSYARSLPLPRPPPRLLS